MRPDQEFWPGPDRILSAGRNRISLKVAGLAGTGTHWSDCNNILSIWICRVRLSASYPRAQWLRKEYVTEHTGWTRQQYIPQSR